jgi:glycosyltransferase involved in cell wall biosynthesis
MNVEKQRIIHCIDSLITGGAETLLKNSIELLPEFEHTVVSLAPLVNELNVASITSAEVVSLDHTGWKSLFRSIIKLRSIIKNKKPLLVHSHLFYSSICARLAVPSRIPLLSSLHSLYSRDAFLKNRKSLLAERFTLKNNHAILAVSKEVLEDYLKYVPFKGKSFILHNFLPATMFVPKQPRQENNKARFVAIGNLKEAKNYFYLLQIFQCLKRENVSLDIYGTGYMQKNLQEVINAEDLPVKLCGWVRDMPAILSRYDYFIQASSHEGFGISVIEAMASNLAVFLSDIPVFREITKGLAVFFPLDDPQGAASLIINNLQEQKNLASRTREAFAFVKKEYGPEEYKRELLKIYSEITGKAVDQHGARLNIGRLL